MKPRFDLSPAQLVLVALFGFVIAVASLPLTRFTHTRDACDCIRWIPVLLVFGLFLVGIAATLYASRSLKNGIANQQWPEDRIATLRSSLESPLVNALPIVLLAAYAVLWLLYPKFRAIGLTCFLLMQVIAQLRTAVRSTPATHPSLIAGWRDLTPIHSDQWGQR